MISKTEFIEYLTKNLSYTYNKDKNTMTNDKGQEIDADSFFKTYKELSGQSFECIYDEHVSCFSIIRCTECGTFIFEHYDEDYEQNLRCPVCTDYKTGFKYYTKEDIEHDENKQKEIDMYKEFARIQKEADERYVKHGNLYDFEKTQKKTIFKGKKYKIDVQLIGFGKWDLEAKFHIWKKENEYIYTCKSHFSIPLSSTSIYMKLIYRHLGKCHKDLRSKFYIGKARKEV